MTISTTEAAPVLDYGSSRNSAITRLCIMMFLEFFIWGAWYVTVGNFMNANRMAGAIAWAYSVGPIAAIVSPFFLGMVADRFFASERVLGVMHLIGGCAMFVAAAPISLIRRLHPQLVFDLHPAGGVLRVRAGLRRCDEVQEPGVHHVLRADVRSLFHAHHAAVLRLPGREVHAAGGNAGVGDP